MEKKWYQKLSNWLSILVCIILIPLLLINLSIILQAKNNEDAVPSIFGYKPFIVLSGSMETEIFRGDLIIVKNTNPKDLKINDVIAFRDAEDTVTTHRIIDIIEKDENIYFVTKGDNNSSQDQNLVELKDVEGLYITKITGLGNVFNSLAKPTNVIILFLLITLAFGIGFYISTKKERSIEHQEFLEYKRQKQLANLEKENAGKDESLPKEVQNDASKKN